MAPKPKKPVKPSNVVEIVERPDAPSKLKNIGGSSSDDFNNLLANQALRSLWMAHYKKPEDIDEAYQAGLSFLINLKPKDEIEGMIGAQLFACHNAAMESFRRAMISEQSLAGRAQNLAFGNKCARTFAGLLDALNRYRGKGAQRIVIERVSVHDQAQAIVGGVTAGGGE
jgi:hypothetical protein